MLRPRHSPYYVPVKGIRQAPVPAPSDVPERSPALDAYRREHYWRNQGVFAINAEMERRLTVRGWGPATPPAMVMPLLSSRVIYTKDVLANAWAATAPPRTPDRLAGTLGVTRQNLHHILVRRNISGTEVGLALAFGPVLQEQEAAGVVAV